MSKPQEVTVMNPCLKICPSYRHRLRWFYDLVEATRSTALKCEDPSRAVQSQKEEADINTIVRRFKLTGQVPSNVRMPQYGDFTGIGTYQEALNAVLDAQKAFLSLPANVRERFGHDPEKLIEFISDEKNRDEAVSLGLINKNEPATEGGVPPTKAAGKPAEPKKVEDKPAL